MDELHKVLHRQIVKAGLSEDEIAKDPKLSVFISRINKSYHENDENHYLLERAMKVSSEEMRQLYSTIEQERATVQSLLSEGICITDQEWYIKQVNYSFCKHIGLEEAAIIGRYYFDIISIKNIDNNSEFDIHDLKDALKMGRHKMIDKCSLVSKVNGQPMYASLSFNPNILHTAIHGVVIVSKNIESTIEYERKLKNAILHSKEINKAKSQFLANMSHEIRTPILGIIGSAELLLTTGAQEKQKKYIDTIMRSSELLLTVIDDILDISKIEAGKLMIEKYSFNLKELIDELLNLFGPMCERKNIKLVYHDSGNLPCYVIGDKNRVKQVISNMLNNSIKFTDQGSVELSINLEQRQGNRCKLLFTISDTGIGIPEEKKQIIFESFSQADVSVSRKYGGVGLGLSICKALVHLMKGDIGIGTKKQGATLYFSLPFEIGLRNENMPYKIILNVPHMIEENLISLLKSWGISYSIIKNIDEILNSIKSTDNTNYYLFFEKNDKNLRALISTIENKPGNQYNVIAMLDKYQEDIECELISDKEFIQFYNLSSSISGSKLHNILIQIVREKETDLSLSENKNLVGEVLVVEDNLVNQEIIKEILTLHGLGVDVAENGREAIMLVKNKKYDVILMDCQMPIMDGYRATKIIRRLERDKNYKNTIIALTAHAMRGEKDKCLQIGMNDYIAKPFRQEELLGKLNKYLAKNLP